MRSFEVPKLLFDQFRTTTATEGKRGELIAAFGDGPAQILWKETYPQCSLRVYFSGYDRETFHGDLEVAYVPTDNLVIHTSLRTMKHPLCASLLERCHELYAQCEDFDPAWRDKKMAAEA